mmetsp:Transcript_19470/g.48793  ORF Transcript_19470/g.48793 Transcript_19470/m.48793 type:complete len:179 (+) Transcript_19470:178-714(+)|eukprot:CAMPEP_0178983490 /NCGR_PEP_ID=MMETSP0795-20121207/1088_1 /TAXON_ID=88552 /ORGANISM="Amoebophrya sp., Strain Ameob2" /LENGTH=178 /DNA_ID=CAMNT_0020674267 /DNA_START=134 /DNA_END=670 /DNA_ORIENTATION=+
MPVFDSISLDSRQARDKMVFMFYDRKGKGSLTKQDLFPALQAGGALLTEREYQKMLDGAEIVNNNPDAVTNNLSPGKMKKKNKKEAAFEVHFEQFGGLLKKCILRNFRDGVYSEAVLRERFRIFIDAKDTVSTEVLRYISTNLGEKLSAEQADMVLRELDPEHAGRIPFARLSETLLA